MKNEMLDNLLSMPLVKKSMFYVCAKPC